MHIGSTSEADLAKPSILLVTDAYSMYWRARALQGSSQSRYDVLPANYVLRAVPLAEGHHLLRLEFVPPHYHLGLTISFATVTALAGICSWKVRGRVHRRSPARPWGRRRPGATRAVVTISSSR